VARAAARQFSFADVELIRQGLRLEPLLEAISTFLDTQHEIIERVRRDLARGLKKPGQGRPGLTASQVLRALVLMRVKNWDYRELRERIADGLTLRQFTDFYCDPVPKHDAFNRGFNRLTPETLKAVNELMIQAAVALGLEDGAKLRVDTTVVETDIHHPTDNTLLWDVVRVVTRWVKRLAKALKRRRIKGFRDRRRSARRRMYEIQRMTTRQREDLQTGTYRELIGIATEVVVNARTALDKTSKSRGNDLHTAIKIDAIRAEIARYCQLGERVVDQARRRVLDGEQVPNAEKIYSIFESHTDLIKRGKVRTPLEFGHKVFLAESARGLIRSHRSRGSSGPVHCHQTRRSLRCCRQDHPPVGRRDPDHHRSILQTVRQSPAVAPLPQSLSRQMLAARFRGTSKVQPTCESRSRGRPAGARSPGYSFPGSSASRRCADAFRKSVVDRDAIPPLGQALPSRPLHSESGAGARCAPIGQMRAPRPSAGRSPAPPNKPSHRLRRLHPRRNSDAPAVRPRRSRVDLLRSASCSAH
jgi:transposase, IS5 family